MIVVIWQAVAIQLGIRGVSTVQMVEYYGAGFAKKQRRFLATNSLRHKVAQRVRFAGLFILRLRSLCQQASPNTYKRFAID